MQFSKNLCQIISRKYDGSLHRSWKAELLRRTNSLLVFVGEFAEEITHQHLGVIGRGTTSYEFFWLDCYYNVFRFHEPDGAFRNFYCNINLPPVFADDVLEYVDLDVDVLVWTDFSYQILDADEFEENAARFSYPNRLREQVLAAQNELIDKIENRLFPFDYKF